MKELKTVTKINEISITKEGVDIIAEDSKLSYSFNDYSKISITHPFLIMGEEADVIDQDKYFENLISQFNTVLPVPIYSSGSTSSVYTYLKKSFDLAWYEFYKNGSPLFSNDTYPLVYSYRGNNRKYYSLSLDSMTSWLMAMLLSELIPTTGKDTNNQTKLFALAYNIGGGRQIPLYGNYDIHADPMIARLAAGAIYAAHRSSYTFSEIDSLRKLIGGSMINAKDWSGLGYKGEDNVMNGMRYLGYLVNSDVIIPSAAGPYADGCSNRETPWEQGQPKDQFSELNYKIDTAIDDYVVKNFNMGAQTPQSTWDSYSDENKKRILEAVAAPRATDNFFFGEKLIKFDGVHDGNRLGLYANYTYYWFSQVSSTGNNIYKVSGPFADLYNKMLTGGGYGTPTDALKYFDNIMGIADNSRCPTFQNQYGRCRPCGGKASPGASARSSVNGDPLNALYNIDISCIFADSKDSADKWAKEDGFVKEKPKSYPSGHAAMTWAVTMLLGQMSPDTLRKYMPAAYEVGVNRTVARYHWNSDVIYGRLFATMIIPIINAMSGIQASYEKAKNIIFGTQPEPTTKTPGKAISFVLKIKNNRNNAVTIDDKINFVLANPDPNGFYYGDSNGKPYTGKYNRVAYSPNGTGKVNSITIPAGKEASFTINYSDITGMVFNNDLTLYGTNIVTGLGGRNLVSKEFIYSSEWNSSRGKSNILLYVNNDSNVIVPECLDNNFVFEQGKTYTLNIR